MRFWDSSALVPLLVRKSSSEALGALYRKQSAVLVWWAAEVECASAVARLERDGLLSGVDVATAFTRLDRLRLGWSVIDPCDVVTRIARRLLRMHPLRAADAAQLAAALVASESNPATLEFVTLDERLATAAAREGFVVLDRNALES